MQTAIATVCLSGVLNEKLEAIAAARGSRRATLLLDQPFRQHYARDGSISVCPVWEAMSEQSHIYHIIH